MIVASIRTGFENDRPVAHRTPSTGSLGHGVCWAFIEATKLKAMRIPAPAKTISLFSESQTSWGKFETAAATVAPSPSDTSSAGRAQHTTVPNEAKSDMYGNSRRTTLLPHYTDDGVASLGDEFADLFVDYLFPILDRNSYSLLSEIDLHI